MKINVISEVNNFGSINILGKCSSSNFNFIIANHPDHFIPDIQVCSGIGWLNNIVGEVQFVADLIEDFKDETWDINNFTKFISDECLPWWELVN